MTYLFLKMKRTHLQSLRIYLICPESTNNAITESRSLERISVFTDAAVVMGLTLVVLPWVQIISERLDTVRRGITASATLTIATAAAIVLRQYALTSAPVWRALWRNT